MSPSPFPSPFQNECHECRECNNILYPKDDKEQMVLLYACRNCDQQEIAGNNCVNRNEIHHTAGERTQVLQDVAADPTLPRIKSVRFTQCNHGEAVFSQVKVPILPVDNVTSLFVSHKQQPEGKKVGLFFLVCCNPNCGHRWRD